MTHQPPIQTPIQTPIQKWQTLSSKMVFNHPWYRLRHGGIFSRATHRGIRAKRLGQQQLDATEGIETVLKTHCHPARVDCLWKNLCDWDDYRLDARTTAFEFSPVLSPY